MHSLKKHNAYGWRENNFTLCSDFFAKSIKHKALCANLCVLFTKNNYPNMICMHFSKPHYSSTYFNSNSLVGLSVRLWPGGVRVNSNKHIKCLWFLFFKVPFTILPFHEKSFKECFSSSVHSNKSMTLSILDLTIPKQHVWSNSSKVPLLSSVSLETLYIR